MTPPIDPVFLQIGNLPIYWYGILVVTGILVGAQVAAYLAEKGKVNPERVWDMLLVAVITAIIGARIEYVIVPPHWEYYRAHLIEILYTRQGGLRFYGAIIGGALGVLGYSYFAKTNPLRMMDFAAPGLALGHAIGRWGNFINYELYGPPTTLPWGLDIPITHRVPPYNDFVAYPLGTTLFHPAFLYESLLDLTLSLLLIWLSRKLADKLRPGTIVLSYVMGYSVIRFFMDYMRTDGTNAQSVAIIAFVICAVALVLQYVILKPGSKSTATA